MTLLAITIVGPDRAGLINQIASIVAQQKGNWLESHMANLAGQFAGIVQLDVATENVVSLTTALNSLAADDLKINIATASPAIDAPNTASLRAGRTLTMELLGQDHPGIIRDITRTLSEQKISIEELETSTFSASMSGEAMFSAVATLSVPETVSNDQLDAALQVLSSSLMVDITLEADT
ncbi:MAG: glycine cleavage system protein R [Granulosicoccus sp.]|nr:glycine cleavage system protein R [Granulosicoccus sp.]